MTCFPSLITDQFVSACHDILCHMMQCMNVVKHNAHLTLRFDLVKCKVLDKLSLNYKWLSTVMCLSGKSEGCHGIYF